MREVEGEEETQGSTLFQRTNVAGVESKGFSYENREKERKRVSER
jgi:hypothetical protein